MWGHLYLELDTPYFAVPSPAFALAPAPAALAAPPTAPATAPAAPPAPPAPPAPAPAPAPVVAPAPAASTAPRTPAIRGTRQKSASSTLTAASSSRTKFSLSAIHTAGPSARAATLLLVLCSPRHRLMPPQAY
ncbi:hypothetical protein BJ170DRAFT_596987 [Xylariales sp. AK1849]|nr:hypothetical protein BJ170DRAFT_596987 [Xylariales sp. AK1849]